MLFPLGLALLRYLHSTIRDVSGCNKGNYFLCIVLLYVRIHNDLWMTYDDSKDLRLNKCSKILLLFECTFFGTNHHRNQDILRRLSNQIDRRIRGPTKICYDCNHKVYPNGKIYLIIHWQTGYIREEEIPTLDKNCERGGNCLL